MNIENNPAEIASIESITRIKECIDSNKSFRLEAGAGAGKTYSLIESLKYIIINKADNLIDKRIACITYTNIAKEEILNRTDNHPLIYANTIHSFCWELIQPFQLNLRNIIVDLSDKWREKVQITALTNQQIKYDLGIMKISDTEAFLHHDDVIKCMSKLLSLPKFQKYLKTKFPIVFIDEYQDTDKNLANNLVNYLVENDSGVLVGFFGDHWQKIYGKNACGLINTPSGKIVEINKNANFRSDKNIVDCLNRIRKELPQNEYDPTSKGVVKIFHSNNWSGERQSLNHWQGDLPKEEAKNYIDQIKIRLIQDGWDFNNSSQTKILFLTNNLIATEQGFKNLADCFEYTDDYLKKNDPYLKFFLEVLEPIILAFNEKKFGKIFQILGTKKPNLLCQNDKSKWSNHFSELVNLRETGTIKDLIKLIAENNIIGFSASLERCENKLSKLVQDAQIERNEDDNNFVTKVSKLYNIKYSEVISLGEYIEEKTPFSTKHGVKGAEFNNVFVVLGRGWNNYNWDQLLLWMKNGIPNGKEEAFERNRNLFYVCCSRAKHNLTLLFTQSLSSNSLLMLEEIFGAENITGDPLY
ncbi:UvrD-helicase domain-containing protein [Acinetobacter baumannii]|nr:ATP-dependent helicase [Acinetobacter baumannii]